VVQAEIVRIDEFGLLAAGFRKIRCSIDGSRAVFELVPESDTEVTDGDLVDASPEERRWIAGARRVIEGPLALRIEVHHLIAIAGDADVDADIFGGLHCNWRDAPKLPNSNVFYPLLEITNSPWKIQLPEWRRRDDPDVRHVRMISAECSYDILGEFGTGVWVANVSD
jgi:hypothetical protein